MTRDSEPIDNPKPPESVVNTTNEFLLGSNGAFIVPHFHPRLTTRQQAFRFAAWCALMGETLPDEEPPSTFQEIIEAVRNTQRGRKYGAYDWN